MPFVRPLIRSQAALLLPLLALALLVRALVPQGYMPTAGGERLFSIQICSATSAGRTVDFAVPAGDDDQRSDHPADMPCAFQALGLMATGAAPAPLVLLNLRQLLAQGLAPAIAGSVARPAAAPPPSTGPPALR
jgi:hypothetical protein